MKHPLKSILLAYYENTLSASLDDRVKSHIEKCDQCQSSLNKFMEQDKVLSASEPKQKLDDQLKNSLFDNVFQMIDDRALAHKEHDLKKEKRKKKRKEARRKTSLKLDELILSPTMGAAFSILIILLLTYNRNQEVEYKQERVFDLETTIVEGGDY